MIESDERLLEAVLQTLEPFLSKLVVVGGLAHRLHARDPRARRDAVKVIATYDVDLALDATPTLGKRTIRSCLSAGGFEEVLIADAKPPSCRNVPQDGTSTSGYVEFIAPRRGDGYSRTGVRRATTQISGVSAWELAHVDLLLVRPWNVEFDVKSTSTSPARRLSARVVNPTAYLVQKLLVLAQRSQAKRAKDALYIHDTLVLFGHDPEPFREEWGRMRAQLPKATMAKLDKQRRVIEREDSITLDAARIARAQGRPGFENAAEFARTCQLGLQSIFD